MKQELRIKLKIADRSYPITIAPNQEEAYRKAADEINRLVRLFEENYAINDRQDSLAMCAISVASQLFSNTIEKENQNTQNQERIEKIHHLLDSILQK